jgi:hypothetical protein
MLREPLTHFVALGAVLFAVDAWTHRQHAAPRTITYDRAFLQGLAQDLARRDGRSPSGVELRAAAEALVREEVLYREGLTLGLERGDLIVRRRVVQKMEFLLEDTDLPAEPSEARLQAWLDAHPERFVPAPRVSLEQVFFDQGRRGGSLQGDVERARQGLLRGDAPGPLGDPFVSGGTLLGQSPAELAALLGEGSARAVTALPVGAWSEPLPSRYGLHLVRVTERTQGSAPGLSEVRDAVRAEVHREDAERRRQDAVARLVQRYDVRLELPPEAPPRVAQRGSAP